MSRRCAMAMAVARPSAKRQALGVSTDKALSGLGGKAKTSAQRIEEATVQKNQVIMSDIQCWDAEALFRQYDSERTQLLSRGSLVDLLREIGLDKQLGDSFGASARLAFDAHSADSHFLGKAEFKQLYYHISHWHPDLLPRETSLKITLMSAKDLPSTDANGKSDPFCTVTCCHVHPDGKIETKGWSKSATKVVEKTLAPWWGEDFTDKYGYVEGDSLLLQVWDWDQGDKSELIARAILPGTEFHRPGGFHATLPMTCMVSDAPRGTVPLLSLRVVVKGSPELAPRLRVKIHSAMGLPPIDLTGKNDCTCTFQIVGKSYSRSTTKICFKTCDPVWNENFDGKDRYEDGDNLVFEVRTNGGKAGKNELLGRCVLTNNEFSSLGGWHGDVPLIDVARAMIPNPDTPTGRHAPKLKVSAWLQDMMPDDDEAFVMRAQGIVNAATALLSETTSFCRQTSFRRSISQEE